MSEKLKIASCCRMGAVCAYIAGFSYFLIVICAFLSPTSVASYVTSKQYFLDFESYKYYFIFLKSVMVVANAAIIGVVLAVFKLREPENEGWVTLLSLLAVIGLGIGMLQSVLDATQVPHLALEYENSPSVIQHVIIAFGVANPALYILSLGVPGIWFIYINLLYLKKFPGFLVILGVAWGIGNITTVFAHLFVVIWLIYCIAGGALIAAPLWSIWQARFLLGKAKQISSKK